jgi:hypothetical protein
MSGFLSPKEHPVKMNFKCEEIPQIMHFLFLPPCLIENTIHCCFSKFLPQQSGHCPRDLARAFDIGNSKGAVLTAPLIHQQRFIVMKQTFKVRPLPLPQAHLLGSEAGGWKDHVPARPRISWGPQSTEIWSVRFRVGLDRIHSQNL